MFQTTKGDSISRQPLSILLNWKNTDQVIVNGYDKLQSKGQKNAHKQNATDKRNNA